MPEVVGESGSRRDYTILDVYYISVYYIFFIVAMSSSSARQYIDALSNETIQWLVSREEVVHAKSRLLDRRASSDNSKSEYFTLPFTAALRDELFETMGLQLSAAVSSIPMRWMIGDTPAHNDHGLADFTNTYLVYLTNSPGNLVVDGSSYPIRRGYGYVFSEGLMHETVGTTDGHNAADAEPRLLLGPMSDMGFSVGFAPGIYNDGGTTIYIRQTAVGQELEFSSDQISWYQVYWPCYIQNTNTSLGVLTIEFITDITIDATIGGNNGYFIVNSENIQVGSRVLKPDGTRPAITIDTITNYEGLIRNGTGGGGGVSGYNSVFIMNLEIRATGGAHLVNGGGWVAQGHFGNNTTASTNIIINCHSNGVISNNSGGIIGHYCGPVKCIACSSSGAINQHAGGIVGSHSPSTSGSLRCESCWTTGAIGHFAGGITGESSGTAIIINCYSTGVITENAGGISGHLTGGNGGGAYVVNDCYSTGTINDHAGGILGSDTGVVTVSNCYSLGAILATGGGIIGRVPGSNSTNKSITNCYTTGITAHAHSYIVAGYVNVNTNLTVHTGTITLANNYSEAANSSSGWNNVRSNTVLTGTPASASLPVGVKWVYTGNNTPYELYTMGHTPYTRTVVTGSATSPAIVRSFTSETAVEAGTSSSPAIISGRSYSVIQIAKNGVGVGSYPTITMNTTTGAVATARETAVGTYTITLRNSGSYHITILIMTVTEAAARPYNPCRFFGLFTNNAQVFYNSHSLASGGVGTVRNYRRKARRT
jgi:hypothetical protein